MEGRQGKEAGEGDRERREGERGEESEEESFDECCVIIDNDWLDERAEGRKEEDVMREEDTEAVCGRLEVEEEEEEENEELLADGCCLCMYM